MRGQNISSGETDFLWSVGTNIFLGGGGGGGGGGEQHFRHRACIKGSTDTNC